MHLPHIHGDEKVMCYLPCVDSVIPSTDPVLHRLPSGLGQLRLRWCCQAILDDFQEWHSPRTFLLLLVFLFNMEEHWFNSWGTTVNGNQEVVSSPIFDWMPWLHGGCSQWLWSTRATPFDNCCQRALEWRYISSLNRMVSVWTLLPVGDVEAKLRNTLMKKKYKFSSRGMGKEKECGIEIDHRTLHQYGGDSWLRYLLRWRGGSFKRIEKNGAWRSLWYWITRRLPVPETMTAVCMAPSSVVYYYYPLFILYLHCQWWA